MHQAKSSRPNGLPPLKSNWPEIAFSVAMNCILNSYTVINELTFFFPLLGSFSLFSFTR
jgi:hypothetical protein